MSASLEPVQTTERAVGHRLPSTDEVFLRLSMESNFANEERERNPSPDGPAGGVEDKYSSPPKTPTEFDDNSLYVCDKKEIFFPPSYLENTCPW